MSTSETIAASVNSNSERPASSTLDEVRDRLRSELGLSVGKDDPICAVHVMNAAFLDDLHRVLEHYIGQQAAVLDRVQALPAASARLLSEEVSASLSRLAEAEKGFLDQMVEANRDNSIAVSSRAGQTLGEILQRFKSFSLIFSGLSFVLVVAVVSLFVLLK